MSLWQKTSVWIQELTQGAHLVNPRGGPGGLQFVGYVVGCCSSSHVDPMALSVDEGAWTGGCLGISFKLRHWCEVVGGSWGIVGNPWVWMGGITQQGCVGASEDGFWKVVLVGAHGVHLGCSKAHQTCCSSHLACLHVLRVCVSSHGVHYWVAGPYMSPSCPGMHSSSPRYPR